MPDLPLVLVTEDSDPTPLAWLKARARVVGASTANAEYPRDRPLSPGDLLATIYHVLGIDPNLTFKDHSGRPVAILDEGKAIAEVI